MLTEWRRRRIIREEYQRLLEEGFRAQVRCQMMEQLTEGAMGQPAKAMKSLQVAGMALVPVLIVISEGVLLMR